MMNAKRNISDVMSRKISHLMFIMSVMVVFIHFADLSFIQTEGYKIEQITEYLFSQALGRVAVPLFFCISGYLTFSKNNFSSKDILLSLKKKVKTLVIPYLFWNCFYFVVTLSVWFVNGTFDSQQQWIPFVLKSVFLYECNYALWYVFQLIIINILSPLLFYVYKNKYSSLIFSFFALCAYLFVNNAPIWLPLNGLGFFSIGATMALHFREKIDVFFWSEKKRKVVSIAALISFVILCIVRMTFFDITQSVHEVRAMPLCRVLEAGLAFSFWFLVDLFYLGKKQVKQFENTSFLIYVTHTFAIVVVNFIFEYINISMSPTLRLVIYLIIPLVITLAVVLVSDILRKILPRFYALISGGR